MHFRSKSEPCLRDELLGAVHFLCTKEADRLEIGGRDVGFETLILRGIPGNDSPTIEFEEVVLGRDGVVVKGLGDRITRQQLQSLQVLSALVLVDGMGFRVDRSKQPKHYSPEFCREVAGTIIAAQTHNHRICEESIAAQVQ